MKKNAAAAAVLPAATTEFTMFSFDSNVLSSIQSRNRVWKEQPPLTKLISTVFQENGNKEERGDSDDNNKNYW